ncbi:MAG: NPCBM/NEW2 domain-containing protein [Oscillospiraceae bacterium]|nr:NPCBM/NEW2 domain-containing protein [Oscillospiraceae bacterium]
MFCPNCGKKVNDNGRFCPHCGSPVGILDAEKVTEAPAMSVIKPKQNKKKNFKLKFILIAVVFAVILVVILSVVAFINSSAYSLSKSLKDGDYGEAVSTYNSDVKDNSLQILLTNWLLSGVASDVIDDYSNEDISYEEALAYLMTVSVMTDLDVSEDADLQIENLEILYNSKTAYELAESYYDAGDYEAAMDAYQKVDESDTAYYEDAQSKIEQSKDNYRADIIEKVGSPSTVSEYETAISFLTSALSVLPNDEELTALLETCKSELVETVKSNAITDATEAIASNNYEQAFEVLEDALTYAPDDTDLLSLTSSAESQYEEYVSAQVANFVSESEYEDAFDAIDDALDLLPDSTALQELEDTTISQYESYITSQVNVLISNDDYDGALNLISRALKLVPGNTVLKELKTKTEEQKPVDLSDLIIVNSSRVETVSSAITDRWGNYYDGAVKYDASYDAFALYNLNDSYTEFTATVFVSTEATSGKNMSIAIYVDDSLVYYKDSITEESMPFTISIDVTNATTMKIVTDNAGSFNSGILYFADAVLSKN